MGLRRATFLAVLVAAAVGLACTASTDVDDAGSVYRHTVVERDPVGGLMIFRSPKVDTASLSELGELFYLAARTAGEPVESVSVYIRVRSTQGFQSSLLAYDQADAVYDVDVLERKKLCGPQDCVYREDVRLSVPVERLRASTGSFTLGISGVTDVFTVDVPRGLIDGFLERVQSSG